MAIEIKVVQTKSDLAKFIRFQNKLYENHPYYVPALEFDEKNTLRSDKNPAFEFCEAQYWLAYRDGKIVGRIAGIINNGYIKKWGNNYSRFGWVDFIDDFEVSKALFDAYEKWAKEKGMVAIHGPLGFTDLDKEGLMIEGFDELGTYSTLYNFPYYQKHFEKLGLIKDVDWLQWEVKIPEEVPQRIRDFSKLVMQKYKLHKLETKRAKDILPYAPKMFNLINIAYDDLYGVVPLTQKQIDAYTKQYFGFVRHEFITFVIDEHDDVVAFGITIPSISKAVQKSKGKLFPFGFIHLLKALKKNDTADMLLIGIHPKYQNKGLHTIIFTEITQTFIDNKISKALVLPQLEENRKANQLWKTYESKQTVRRRCYIKTI